MSKSCSRKINKTRYDDLGKPMKQTSFTIKNLGGNLPEKQSTIVKRSFKSSTKPLSLDSTVGDIFLCNWHILWQNTLYLYLGKSEYVQDDHYKLLNWRHEDYSRTA